MNRQMLRGMLLTLFLVFGWLPASAQGNGLVQTNPVKMAPNIINDTGSDGIMDHNEYPWFSRDGRLFFWTRQMNPAPGEQWLWVTYIKNRGALSNTPAGGVLPNLDLAVPVEMHEVNHHFIDHVPGSEIKALAVCEEWSPTQPQDLGDRWRYRFTFYLAVGPPMQRREMYRAHRVIVVVRKSDQEIIKVSMAGEFDDAIPQAIRPSTGGIANETEPFLNPHGDYLFWASNAWDGGGKMAHFIGPMSACTQLNQPARPYSELPPELFAWKDQYSTGETFRRTSRTNYHTMITRQDQQTTLIFEECRGQTACVPGQEGNRECECEAQNNALSTTGFGSGRVPQPITNFPSSPLNPDGGRATHPAISGPQNPDGSWLLFFMKGKRIWYTKIAEELPKDQPVEELSVVAHSDAFVAQTWPDSNYGQLGYLRVRFTATGTGRYSFLKFAVPAVNGTIESAVLRIRTLGTVIPSAAIYQVNNMVWAEGAVTWNNWDEGGASFTFLRPSGELPANQWHEIDVAEAISESGGVVTLGMTSSYDLPALDVYSSESAYSPTLEITYRPD